MTSGQLFTWAAVVLCFVISVAASSSELSTARPRRLRGPHVCGLNRDRCCTGWRLSPSRLCTIPVCDSNNCMPGGTCIRPYLCRCADGNLGRNCASESRFKRMAEETRAKYTKRNGFEGPCSPDVCGQICESLSGNRYQCACSEGYLLQADRRSCIRDTFTGWTGDQYSPIAPPQYSDEQRKEDIQDSGQVFRIPYASPSPNLWDLGFQDPKFLTPGKIPYASLPPPGYDVMPSAKKMGENYEDKVREFVANGKVEPEEKSEGDVQVPWYGPNSKGDEKSLAKLAPIKPVKKSQLDDWLKVKDEKITMNPMRKDSGEEDFWKTKTKSDKTDHKVSDIPVSQDYNSWFDLPKTETRSEVDEAKLLAEEVIRKKDEERKYFDQIEGLKKEIESRAKEMEEYKKRKFEKSGSEKKMIEKTESENKGYESKENESKENIKKYYKKGIEKTENEKKEYEKKEYEMQEKEIKENKKKYYKKKGNKKENNMMENDKNENNKKEQNKKEYKKKEIKKKESGKRFQDDKAGRRLVSLVHSPKYPKGMPKSEEADKKSSKLATSKVGAWYPVNPKAIDTDKKKAKQFNPKFNWQY